MNARIIVVTGANSGIGFETALYFTQQGAEVVMACRNMDKAEKARSEILSQVPEGNIVAMKLDVSDLSSVKSFGQQFASRYTRLDILVNNAGIVAVPLTRNEAGHELQLATNYLGAFALTGILLPVLSGDIPARVVNVGSLAHRLGKLDPDELNWQSTPYHQWKAYANSKLAMMSYTLELDRRLRKTGSNVKALGAHPGFANTNIHQNSPALQRRSDSASWLQKKWQSFVPSAPNAARPVILAADSENAKGGEYYGPGGFLETGIHGKPGKAKVNRAARDVEIAGNLWAVSESMTGVRYLSDMENPESDGLLVQYV